jgi:ribulose-5-phosphate 4-epimerase/fuculose-1-phosphate aldolase
MAMSSFATLIQDLVIANRILAKEEVVDAYGHVSVRHPDNPTHFLIARSVAPELVTTEDIVELDLDGQPVRDEKRTLYLERFIHAAIFEARPDVTAVVHAHAEDTLAFGVADATKLRPVIHSGSFIGTEVPVWDIAENFGDTNLLVSNMEQGRDLAKCRGHGFASAGRTLIEVVRMSVFAAQRTHADAGEAAGGHHQIPVTGRNRCPQPRVQPLFDRDLARLGILGE